MRVAYEMPLSDPTICSRCRFYRKERKNFEGKIWIGFASFSVPPVPGGPDVARCTFGLHKVPRLNCVTGISTDYWNVPPVSCFQKNRGDCADYEYNPNNEWDRKPEPQKHWWQK